MDTLVKLRIKLVRSPIGRRESHKRTLKALGLGKMNSSVEQVAAPQIRGMVRKVDYLLNVEEVPE